MLNLEHITSAKNAKVKHVKDLLSQAKARRKAAEFVCEGRRLCEEIPPELIREVWISESFAERIGQIERIEQIGQIKQLAQIGQIKQITGTDECLFPAGASADRRTYVVPDSLFRSMSDTAGPQGVLAVVRMPTAASHEGNDRKILMLEGLQDPGNLGTIFRTAEAAGISEIILDRGCVDVFSPKVVRSTMGSIFRVPFSVCEDMPARAAELAAQGWRVFAACLGADMDFRDADYGGDCAILIGNEGNGLSEAAVAAATDRVIIPMQGGIESLNASVAAALMMYEAVRNRA